MTWYHSSKHSKPNNTQKPIPTAQRDIFVRNFVTDSDFLSQIMSMTCIFRKILNELSSDVRAVPKIEEEEKVEEEALATSSVATVTAPSSIYQTSSGQYSTSELITHKLLCLCAASSMNSSNYP